MANQVVSLNTAVSPYEADLAQIAQRQKLAEMLQQQSSAPEQTFSYNGIQAPIPATAGLNKILSGLLSGYMAKKNIQDQRDLSTTAQTDASNWITKLTQGTQAQPEVPGSVQATPADVEDRQQGIDMGSGAAPMTSGQAIPVPGGQGEGANVGSPAVAGGPLSDSQRMATLMQGMNNPLTAQMAGPMAMQEMQRQRLIAAFGGGSSPSGGAAPQSPVGPSGGVPMAGGGASGPMPATGPATPNAPSGPLQSAMGGPAGGKPLDAWLAVDPSGKSYMEQLAKDYEASIKPVINRGFGVGTMGPNGYRADPASLAQISDAVAAQEAQKYPYKEVTLADGRVVPAFMAPGFKWPNGAAPTMAPGQPPAPSAAPPSAAPIAPTLNPAQPLSPNPAPPVTSAPIAPPTSNAPPMPSGQPRAGGVGQSTANKTYNEGAAKNSVDYENEVRSGAASSVTQNRMLDDLANNLGDMNPGKLADFNKASAQWKVAVGFGGDEATKTAAAGEVADKLTGQLVSNALKGMTARPTQSEFTIFLNKFVPNMNMTPQGAKAVLGFMRQQNNLNMMKQQAFQEAKKTMPVQNYRDFDTTWNQKQSQLPLTSEYSFGSTATNPQTGQKMVFDGEKWSPQ